RTAWSISRGASPASSSTMATSGKAPPPASTGFTLMEIMAAVFMLGVLLLPLLTVKERATSRVERAHARMRALVHAERMLSEARTDPRERLQQEGRVEADEWFRYEFTVEDWDLSTSFADPDDEDAEDLIPEGA